MERSLERSEFVELVQDFLRESIFFQLNNHANLTTSGLIASVGDVVEFFREHEVTNLVNKIFLAHAIWNFGDDDIITTVSAFLNVRYGANHDRTFTSCISLLHRRAAINFGAGREIWTLNIFHQPFKRNVRIINLGDSSINKFAKVMRWDVSCHTDSNTHLSV